MLQPWRSLKVSLQRWGRHWFYCSRLQPVGEPNYFKPKNQAWTSDAWLSAACGRRPRVHNHCYCAKLLTLGEARRVVVDVCELDGDGGGARQAAKVAPHVLSLEQHQVLVLGLPVHVGHGRAQDTWGSAHASLMTVTHRQQQTSYLFFNLRLMRKRSSHNCSHPAPPSVLLHLFSPVLHWEISVCFSLAW